jgi:sialate O-acetylesterase
MTFGNLVMAQNNLISTTVVIDTGSQQFSTANNNNTPGGFAKNEFDIYLLIGQSNMAGRADIGVLDEVPLDNAYLFNDADGWENAETPLNKYSSTRKDLSYQKLNLGYTFARKLATYTGKGIGLIVNARGGTSIEQWQKGYNGSNDFNLYEEAVTRLLKAEKDGVFKGIIWHQGESNQSSSSTYMPKLKQLVQDLRTDLGNENVFFVAGEINQWRAASEPMNEVIRSIAKHINQSSYVKSDGLKPINNDLNDPHFDAFSQRILGNRYADEILKNVYKISPERATLYSQSDLRTQLELPAIFSDHMVLQQNTNVPIWGWAKPGETIRITNNWDQEKTKVVTGQDGIWKTEITTSKAGGPFTLNIKSSNKSIGLKDVLLGEVWVCSGQSNMGFYFGTSLNGKEEVAKANYPNIRYLDVERQVSDTPLIDVPGSKWVAVGSEKAAKYSAIAIYFAEKLQKEMNVPVGLIEVAWGGTAADNWTPKGVLENDPKLEIALERYKEWQSDFKMDSTGYYAQLDAKEKGLISKTPEMPTSLFIKARPHRAPSSLYNGLINPLTNFGIKGVLWYQGETNRKWHDEYAYLFESMITSWRKAWGKDLPFYFVQIAPFKGSIEEVSAIMEAQLQVYREVDNTGIVVTMDVGNMDDIHPTNKKPVGERLANWALANSYGFKNISVSGPLFKDAKVEVDKLRVSFDFAQSGLKIEGEPSGFEIVEFKTNGTHKTPKTIIPKIENDTLIFNVANFDKPFILRYGWADKMVNANLFNKEGLPASSFRVLIK